MAVAREAAMSVSSIGGYEVGCAVISPDHNEVVIVAGDGRKRPWTEGHDWGNPLEHAVMRAVGLVATKRKIREGIKAGTPVDLDSERFQPQTEVEKKYFHAMTGSMGGDPAKDSSVVMNNEKETGNSATEGMPLFSDPS